MKRYISGIFLSVLCMTGTLQAADIATNKMMLRGVDKITGRVSTMAATVNQPLKFGTLTIIPERCLAKPQEEMPENAVYLQIFEETKEVPQTQIFKGWMFSSNPALSPLEHPIYDVWLLNCINQDIMEDLVQPDIVSREQDMHLIADDDNPALAQESDSVTPAETLSEMSAGELIKSEPIKSTAH